VKLVLVYVRVCVSLKACMCWIYCWMSSARCHRVIYHLSDNTRSHKCGVTAPCRNTSAGLDCFGQLHYRSHKVRHSKPACMCRSPCSMCGSEPRDRIIIVKKRANTRYNIRLSITPDFFSGGCKCNCESLFRLLPETLAQLTMMAMAPECVVLVDLSSEGLLHVWSLHQTS
jgi:hypothetical protein